MNVILKVRGERNLVHHGDGGPLVVVNAHHDGGSGDGVVWYV